MRRPVRAHAAPCAGTAAAANAAPAPAPALAIAAAAATALVLALSGCASQPISLSLANLSPLPSADEAAPSTSATPGDDVAATGLTGDVVVLAAASLKGVFTELGTMLEAANPDLTVSFSFAASSAVATQVVAGAPADVLATASAATMATASPFVTDPAVFASNSLVIVTPPDNSGGVTGLADLTKDALRIALCAEEVPCGAASTAAFDAARLTPAPDTYTENVTAALNLVIRGEVDAALVYRTDALDAGHAVGVTEFPEAAGVINDNLVATITEAHNPEAAAAFVALVRSAEGRAVLDAAGFQVP